MADLPGHLVAITSMYTRKLGCFNKIELHDKCKFENEFLEMVFQFLEEVIIY